jgi:substrate import-associated zinc metallohydrolase lipoprotein
MKLKIFTYTFIFLFVLLINACKEEGLTDSPETETPIRPQSALDKWIDSVFYKPYNINVIYTWNDTKNDSSTWLPPKEELVQPFLKAVLKIWLAPYVQSANTKDEFIKDYTCRQLILVGNEAYNQALVSLGIVSNGYRLTIYNVDQLDLSSDSVSLSSELKKQFRALHHEYGHILSQYRNYKACNDTLVVDGDTIVGERGFAEIPGSYTNNWTDINDTQARELGFISAYARSAHAEDFVETLSYYITSTETEWTELLESIEKEEGLNEISRKLQFVTKYMENAYHINIATLRKAVTTAISDVAGGNLEINQK